MFCSKIKLNTVKSVLSSHSKEDQNWDRLSLNMKERVGCIALFVFLVSRDCFVALPRGAMGVSAVCVCGIS